MKKILYLLPLLLLGSCKPTKFVCNQQLISPLQAVSVDLPNAKKAIEIVVETPEKSLQDVAEVKRIIPSSEKRVGQKRGNKFHQIFNRILPQFAAPQDSTIKDPGLKKAKDALELEEKWLKAFLIFVGIGVLAALMLLGVFELALLISEEILLIMLVIAFLGYSVTYYGIIIIFLMHIGVFKNYPELKEKHIKYVLFFFLLPLVLALLLALL